METEDTRDIRKNNLVKAVERIKNFNKRFPNRAKFVLIAAAIIITLVMGCGISAVSSLTGEGSVTFNPFILLFNAWFKAAFISFPLLFIIYVIAAFINTNMENKLYDEERNFQISEKGTHGTGGFMGEADKEKALIRDTVDKIDGTLLGIDPDTKLLCSPKSSLWLNGHKAVCGGSGARKTTTQVFNDLLQYIKCGESFLVTDPKGEIYESLSVLCERHGYTTRVYNLRELRNSDGVDFVKSLRDENGDRDKEVSNAQVLGQVIMANTSEKETGGFWEDNQRGLLTAAILYVMYDKSGATEPTLAGAYNLLLKSNKTKIDQLFASLGNDHPAKAMYNLYAKTEDKVRDSVINGLIMRLQVLMTNAAQRAVSTDEIDLALPSKQKCAYFIITSDQNSTFDYIAAMFYTLFFIRVIGYVDSLSNEEREHAVPVHLVLDEFPSIGGIPDFDKKLATVRSRKVYITVIFQNYGQLQDKYTEHSWQTVIGNCDINIYLGGNDSESTVDYYKKRLDTMTVIQKGKRTTEKILSPTNNAFHPTYMNTESEASRDVMTVDELLRLDPDEEVVFLKSSRPLKLNKFFYKNHPLAAEIVLRNQMQHIPRWRRQEEGIPDLTDEELYPIMEELRKDGKMRDWMDRRADNRNYGLMDFLQEENLPLYREINRLLAASGKATYPEPEEEYLAAGNEIAAVENGASAANAYETSQSRREQDASSVSIPQSAPDDDLMFQASDVATHVKKHSQPRKQDIQTEGIPEAGPTDFSQYAASRYTAGMMRKEESPSTQHENTGYTKSSRGIKKTVKRVSSSAMRWKQDGNEQVEDNIPEYGGNENTSGLGMPAEGTGSTLQDRAADTKADYESIEAIQPAAIESEQAVEAAVHSSQPKPEEPEKRVNPAAEGIPMTADSPLNHGAATEDDKDTSTSVTSEKVTLPEEEKLLLPEEDNVNLPSDNKQEQNEAGSSAATKETVNEPASLVKVAEEPEISTVTVEKVEKPDKQEQNPSEAMEVGQQDVALPEDVLPEEGFSDTAFKLPEIKSEANEKDSLPEEKAKNKMASQKAALPEDTLPEEDLQIPTFKLPEAKGKDEQSEEDLFDEEDVPNDILVQNAGEIDRNEGEKPQEEDAGQIFKEAAIPSTQDKPLAAEKEPKPIDDKHITKKNFAMFSTSGEQEFKMQGSDDTLQNPKKRFGKSTGHKGLRKVGKPNV